MAFDTRAQSLQDRTGAGFLVRAAALAELAHRGAAAEDGAARVRVVSAVPTGDRVLDALLAELAERPRTWKSWIRRSRDDTLEAVEERLTVLGVMTTADRLRTVRLRRTARWRWTIRVKPWTSSCGWRSSSAATDPSPGRRSPTRCWRRLAGHGHLYLVLSRHDRKAAPGGSPRSPTDSPTTPRAWPGR
ncbi:GPP34 family phosphoprotein [Kitasatospora sp. NBC_01539]